MKTVSTRKALFMSVLSLLVCFSMLVGTTFAWFTDSVTSANNIIKSGNLDVKLEYSTDMNTWTEVTTTTNVFKADTKWEPGYTEVVYLRVSNIGSLALRYRLGVYIASEEPGTNKDGDQFNLSKYIEYGIDETVTAKYTSRAAAVAAVKDNADTLSKYAYNKEGNHVGKNGTTVDEDVVAMVVYMPEEVGNVANHNGTDIPVINLGLDLFATQDTVESDSFGPDYDDAAWVMAHADATVKDQGELNTALANGGLVALSDNIDGDLVIDNVAEGTILNFAGKNVNGTISVAEGAEITINGNGNVDGGNGPAVTVGKDTDVTLAGGTYTSDKTAITIANEKTEVPMKLTIDEGTTVTAPTLINLDVMNGYAGAEIEINGGDFTATKSGSYVYPINAAGANVTINGGNFEATNASSYCYFVKVDDAYNTETGKREGGSVTINDGTFKSTADYTYVVSGSINSNSTAGTVIINGGTYELQGLYSYLTNVGAHVVVNDCTFTTGGSTVFGISYNNTTDKTIEVKGGNYTITTRTSSWPIPLGGFAESYPTDASPIGKVIISGGTINSYICDGSVIGGRTSVDLVADGYKVVDNGNGTYSIVAE